MQWPCTCPISGEEGSSESTEAPDQQDPQDQKQALSRTQSHIQPPHQPGERQHLSTCALYKSVDSKLVQATKKRALEIIQEQQRKRRKDPFEPCRALPSGTFHLYAGSQFRGEQKSGDQSYVVRVDIKVKRMNPLFFFFFWLSHSKPIQCIHNKPCTAACLVMSDSQGTERRGASPSLHLSFEALFGSFDTHPSMYCNQ